MVDFMVEDTTAQGYLALPASGSGAGVLVLHAWWGLNDTFKGVCDRLAAEGYVAFAPDRYDGRVATTIEEAEALVGGIDHAATPRRMGAAADFLRQHPATTGTGIGVVGFSMGAMWAARLAAELRPDDVEAVVLFYGVASDLDTATYSASHAAFQGHFAPGDEWATDEEVRDAEAAIREAAHWFHLYRYAGTKHWFFEPDRPEYDAEAADLAWQRSVAFLKEYLA